ncbi:Aste57867_19711 [Aphanomyces stellatus]|uniref:Aste57867_19711 protein n=1 Tax=Aphanomyces stellatus TaxID=120398 RepID=A0A485LDQ5_9STRA|nr:hypothetical protein As57867_019646 [Aphanomyces stellatus]VFT96410.1 Aste57867_19711 [Aphanomyces stellatus]
MPSLLQPLATKYYIPIRDLLVTRQLESSTMTTHVGNWEGASVLIKSVDPSQPTLKVTQATKALVAEVASMARIQHPNIVDFRGFSIARDTGLVCIAEFMEGQTLRKLLDDKRRFAKLTWETEKIDIAIDVCAALAYMHRLKPALIHRSVKASKVLLSKDRKQAKLSGFGSSRDRSFEHEMTNKIGAVEWSAPELIMEDEDYTEKVDVYSFGVLLTELDTGDLPLVAAKASMASAAFTNKLVSGALRPQLSRDCPHAIALIVRACLQSDAKIRPASSKVLTMLEDAKAELNAAYFV